MSEPEWSLPLNRTELIARVESLSRDYALLVTEHERTEAELAEAKALWHARSGTARLLEIRIRTLEAAEAVVYDGFRVFSALTAGARKRTSHENVSDVLDAVAKLMKASAPPPLPAQTASPFDSDDVPRGTSETPAEPDTLGWCVSSKMGHMCRHEKNADCRDWLPASQMKTGDVK